MLHVVLVNLFEGGMLSTHLSDGTAFPCICGDDGDTIEAHVEDVNGILREFGNIFECFIASDKLPEFLGNVYTHKLSIN